MTPKVQQVSPQTLPITTHVLQCLLLPEALLNLRCCGWQLSHIHRRHWDAVAAVSAPYRSLCIMAEAYCGAAMETTL
jgi:hypothetical protein